MTFQPILPVRRHHTLCYHAPQCRRKEKRRWDREKTDLRRRKLDPVSKVLFYLFRGYYFKSGHFALDLICGLFAYIASQYDLTHTIAPYLDLHMMFPLIQYLEAKELYLPEDLTHVLIDFLRPTNMVDYTLEIIGNLNEGVDPEVEEELVARRDETVTVLGSLEEACGPLLDLLRNDEELNLLITESNFNMEFLEQNFGITHETLDSFYRYGKFTYDCGNYQDVIFIMYYYGLLETDPDRLFLALWGKVAAEILMMRTNDNVANALKDIQSLQKTIDDRDEASLRNATYDLEQLQLRSWLLHWSIFVFYKSPITEEPEESKTEGLEVLPASEMNQHLFSSMIEFWLSQKYLNAIQINCPWLLRYLTAAVIIHKSRRRVLRQIVNVIRQEQYTYKDPITEFIEDLCINFDFEGAQQKLKECEQVLITDYFLENFKDEFMENARLFIFETYCRIHTKIDTSMLSAKLNMVSGVRNSLVVNASNCDE